MTTQTLTQDAAIEQDNLMVWFFTLPPTIFLLVMGYEALEPHVVCVIDVASELLLLWATRYLWGTRGWWLSVPGLLVVHNVLVVYVLGVEEKLTVVIPHVNEMMVEALGVGWRLLGRSMRLVGMGKSGAARELE
jgi:hypothetical protein